METMTPFARATALKNGQPIDRMPIYLFHGTIGAKMANMSYKESEATAANIAAKEIISYRKYHFDNVSVNFGLFGLGRALGNEFKTAEDASPSISKYVLADIAEVSQLNPDLVNLEQDISQQKHYQAIQMIQAEIGAEVIVDYEITGPLTAAASLIEPGKLLRATRKNPAAVHQLLRFSTDCLLRIIDNFASLENVGFSITDPVSSGDLLSPKQYQEFCLPYLREIVDHIHALDKSVVLHICGDTTKNLPFIAATGIDWLSLDQKVNLATAKNVIGDQVGLIGNVDPVNIILQGTPAAIDADVKRCFEAAFDTPKGFCIGPGCSVPYFTSEQNIAAFMQASRRYAKQYQQ